jgi:Dolichyl-phosphate-mannose-protein mannosyltransferase
MRYQQHEGSRSNDRALTWLSVALLAAGIALRLWQYLGASALWTDEATVANNIVGRSFAQLLVSPLAHNQAAPVGFLMIEKLAVTIFGANELALRAYPLGCSVLSLALVWRISKRLLPQAAAPIVLAPLALAPLLIFYAAEAKQYSSDIAISLALLLVALELSDREATERMTTRYLVSSAIAGALAVWLSQPAVLVVTGLGAALALGTIGARGSRGRRPITPLSWIIVAWALSAIAATAVSMNHLTPESQHFMRTFWSDGFWPLSLRHPSALAWPIVRISLLLGGQLGIPTSVGLAWALLAAGGVVATWKHEWRTSLLLAMPLFVALGASAAHLYPLAERLALFLIPSLFLLAAIGATEIAAMVRVKGGAAIVLAVVTVLVLVVAAQALYAAPPVYRREEITPAIAYLRRASRASDASYIYYGAVPAYEFYAARDALPARATLGGCHRGDPNAYLRELDAFRGRARVWLLFAHDLPRLGERETMLAHLGAMGTARDSMVSYGRDTNGKTAYVRLYLYDLSRAAASDTVVTRATASASVATIEPRLQCPPPSE